MDYEVILSPLALDDIDEIVRYIARNDPQAAERVGQKLFNDVASLRKMSQRGSNVHRRPGIKKLLL